MKNQTAAEYAKQLGIEAVENGNADAVIRLLRIVRLCAESQPEFTTDEVMVRSIVEDGVHDNYERRVLGAVMIKAARAKIVEATDRYQRSAFPSCHARPKRVWRSLVRK